VRVSQASDNRLAKIRRSEAEVSNQYGNRGQTSRARRKRNLIPALWMSKNRGWPGDRRGRLQRALVRLPGKRGGDNRAVRSVTSRRLSGSRRLDQAKRGHGQQSPDRVALGLDRAAHASFAPMDHFEFSGRGITSIVWAENSSCQCTSDEVGLRARPSSPFAPRKCVPLPTSSRRSSPKSPGVAHTRRNHGDVRRTKSAFAPAHCRLSLRESASLFP
jgi:hypothetical protein